MSLEQAGDEDTILKPTQMAKSRLTDSGYWRIHKRKDKKKEKKKEEGQEPCKKSKQDSGCIQALLKDREWRTNHWHN